MAIDRAQAIALRFEPRTVTVERGRLARFANATGVADPVYFDVDVARAAGYPDVPAPPTFFFSLELETESPFAWLVELGIDVRHLLHGEQAFTYHALVHAGDDVCLQTRILDAYSRKAGRLDFLVKETAVSRDGTPVAEARTTIVVRNPEVIE